ncbi:MAG TPA: metal ABC transporter permease [Candidatus Dormibacteraeota bacterium]|nr:metal ABC transporter permease [Candidatus Dormibacteraeota bacterium]
MADAFSWNPAVDWQELTRYAFMREALAAGTIAAVVCGLVGYFVVLRGLTFATDALTHVGFAGASGAVLVGISPIAGLLAFTTVTALGMGALDERMRGRDVVTGMILVEALGLGILFLRLSSGSSNEAYALLFGDILALTTGNLVVLAAAGAAALAATAAVFRPLLFASLDDEVAASRGVPVRALATAFLLILAVAVVTAAQTVGALLAVALVVGPAASAHRLTTRPIAGVAVSVGLALAVSWLGLCLAFWLPYPASFFVTSLCAVQYAAVHVATSLPGRRAFVRAPA